MDEKGHREQEQNTWQRSKIWEEGKGFYLQENVTVFHWQSSLFCHPVWLAFDSLKSEPSTQNFCFCFRLGLVYLLIYLFFKAWKPNKNSKQETNKNEQINKKIIFVVDFTKVKICKTLSKTK